MLMRTELPVEHGRWSDMLDKELLMLAVFAVVGVAVTVGLAIAFPAPADTAAEWLAQSTD